MKFIEKHPMIMIIIGIFGISLSAIFVRYSKAPSIVTAFYRLFFTVILLSPMLFSNGEHRTELKTCKLRNFLLSALSGIFLALHFTFWFESLYHTSVASSTAIVCTEVIWVAIGYAIFFFCHLSRFAILSIMITFLGNIFIAFSDSSHASGNALYGDFISLAAAIFVAVYMLIGRKMREEMSTTVYTYIVYFFCMTSLLIAITFQKISFWEYGMNPAICGLLLGIFSTLLGHSIFTWCLKYFSPAFVSASKLCEPVVASILALILFGEMPAILQILGGAITIGGVLLYSHVETADM